MTAGIVPLSVVFDTNIYISAAFKPASYSAKWVQHSQYYKLFISPAIINEIEDKLLNRFGFPREQINNFIADISASAHPVYPRRVLKNITEDDSDHRILECAVEAKAEMIITSDSDLLKLKEFEGIKIFHPSMLKYWFPVE